MNIFDEYCKVVEKDEAMVSKMGFNPYYIKIQSGLDDRIVINNKECINFASNNYLGLATNPIVKESIVNAVYKYGASLCGTPIATGYIDLFKSVEKKLANFLNLEDSLIFPSCYQTNLGIFSAFIDKNDLVLIDRFAHSSLVQGIMATGCKIRPFLHNNIDHIKKILSKAKDYKKIFTVTESVFSTDGTISPLNEIVELCKEYDAIPVVDDSHGIGVLGKSLRGILEKKEIENFNGIYTASLGKAFANSGGIVAGNQKMIKYLRYYCSHLVYSTALTPASLAGIDAVIDIINRDYSNLKNILNIYSKKISTTLKKSGFDVLESEVPINSIKSGTKENTFKIAKLFFEKGILTTPFVEPSVAINEGKVRIIAGANLKESTIDEALRRINSI
jgi:glycine C-acetyltransferase